MAAFTGPVLSLHPTQLTPTGSPPYASAARNGLIPVGDAMGIGFPPAVKSTVMRLFRTSAGVSGTTGLKVELLLADDPRNSNAGAVAVFGATIGPVTTSTPFDESATGPVGSGSTEVTATYTASATPGIRGHRPSRAAADRNRSSGAATVDNAGAKY